MPVRRETTTMMKIEIEGLFMSAAFWGNGLAVYEAGNSISRNSSRLSTTFFLEDPALPSSFYKVANLLILFPKFSTHPSNLVFEELLESALTSEKSRPSFVLILQRAFQFFYSVSQ